MDAMDAMDDSQRLVDALERVSWELTIGDPSFLGWFTVVAYFACAVLAWRTSRVSWLPKRVRWFWIGLSVLLVLLGLNKQLDLQTLMTDIAREIAFEFDWYEGRKRVQQVFIVAISLVAAVVFIGTAAALRQVLRSHLLVLVGCAFTVLFVVVRAASFHHIDGLLGVGMLGTELHRLLELGGVLMIGLGARKVRRRRVRRRVTEPSG